MHRVGARELKQRTGAVIARVQKGDRVLITLRGTPIAVIAPIDQEAVEEAIGREAQRAEALGWLELSQSAFDFWENEEDAVWDDVAVP